MELDDGQKVTIDVEEAKQIITKLARFVQESNVGQSKRQRMQGKKRTRHQNGRNLRMSEAKRNEILNYLNKKLSKRPRTLTNLLRGKSYVPNYLPEIRKMVEEQKNISKRRIGKRTYYVLR